MSFLLFIQLRQASHVSAYVYLSVLLYVCHSFTTMLLSTDLHESYTWNSYETYPKHLMKCRRHACHQVISQSNSVVRSCCRVHTITYLTFGSNIFCGVTMSRAPIQVKILNVKVTRPVRSVVVSAPWRRACLRRATAAIRSLGINVLVMDVPNCHCVVECYLPITEMLAEITLLK